VAIDFSSRTAAADMAAFVTKRTVIGRNAQWARFPKRERSLGHRVQWLSNMLTRQRIESLIESR
jgi:hypothetical protein